MSAVVHTPIINVVLPSDLVVAVTALLPLDNPHDDRLAREAIASPSTATSATVAWLAAVVDRRGVTYDDNNAAHQTPHRWPLEGRAA